MNKKIFVVVLIVCLTFGMAFAAKKADIKVGAQLGYGSQSIVVKFTDLGVDYKTSIGNGGFLFTATGEYGITDEVSAKAEIGINTMGKANSVMTAGGYTLKTKDTDNAGVSFSMYLGAQYAYEINKEISVKGGAGLDVLAGHFSSADDSQNTSIGLGFEVVGCYAIDKQITATLGGKFAWHFINTNEDLRDSDLKVYGTGFQIFAGATYAL